MKTKLGLIGILICSAGLVAMPVAAQERGAHGNYSAQVAPPTYGQTRAEKTHNDHAQYAANAERYSAHPVTAFKRGRDERGDHDRDRRSNRARHERDDFR